MSRMRLTSSSRICSKSFFSSSLCSSLRVNSATYIYIYICILYIYIMYTHTHTYTHIKANPQTLNPKPDPRAFWQRARAFLAARNPLPPLQSLQGLGPPPPPPHYCLPNCRPRGLMLLCSSSHCQILYTYICMLPWGT
jgi:hypothetical protein